MTGPVLLVKSKLLVVLSLTTRFSSSQCKQPTHNDKSNLRLKTVHSDKCY